MEGLKKKDVTRISTKMQLKIRYHPAVNDFWMVVFTAQTCPVKLQQWQSDYEANNWDT